MYWEQSSILGMVGITFVFAYLATTLDDEHIFAKFLFLMTSFGSSLLTTRLGWVILETDAAPDAAIMAVSGLFYLLLLIAMFVFLYFGIYFIKQTWSGVFEWAYSKNNMKK